MSNVGDTRYRLARSSDADAIAALHADSWRRSYRGMLPDAYLDGPIEADRAAVWQARFETEDDAAVALTIVAEREGELAGFAHTMEVEDADWGVLLDNLHVRHDLKRLGVGRRLMAETAAWFDGRGDAGGLHLWVLEDNTQARRFYDALGGRVTGRGVSHEGGASVASLRYFWPELGRLSAYLPQERQALS